jgi:hypothetical protein
MGNNKQRHFCKICNSYKSNEAFSGKGHRSHICKICSLMPKEERNKIEIKDEIFNYLGQSHISKKNVSRLKLLTQSFDTTISELAKIVMEIAEISPYKKRRLKTLSSKRQDLLQKMAETDLIMAFPHH